MTRRATNYYYMAWIPIPRGMAIMTNTVEITSYVGPRTPPFGANYRPLEGLKAWIIDGSEPPDWISGQYFSEDFCDVLRSHGIEGWSSHPLDVDFRGRKKQKRYVTFVPHVPAVGVYVRAGMSAAEGIADFRQRVHRVGLVSKDIPFPETTWTADIMMALPNHVFIASDRVRQAVLAARLRGIDFFSLQIDESWPLLEMTERGKG